MIKKFLVCAAILQLYSAYLLLKKVGAFKTVPEDRESWNDTKKMIRNAWKGETIA